MVLSNPQNKVAYNNLKQKLQEKYPDTFATLHIQDLDDSYRVHRNWQQLLQIIMTRAITKTRQFHGFRYYYQKTVFPTRPCKYDVYENCESDYVKMGIPKEKLALNPVYRYNVQNMNNNSAYGLNAKNLGIIGSEQEYPQSSSHLKSNSNQFQFNQSNKYSRETQNTSYQSYQGDNSQIYPDLALRNNQYSPQQRILSSTNTSQVSGSSYAEYRARMSQTQSSQNNQNNNFTMQGPIPQQKPLTQSYQPQSQQPNPNHILSTNSNPYSQNKTPNSGGGVGVGGYKFKPSSQSNNSPNVLNQQNFYSTNSNQTINTSSEFNDNSFDNSKIYLQGPDIKQNSLNDNNRLKIISESRKNQRSPSQQYDPFD